MGGKRRGGRPITSGGKTMSQFQEILKELGTLDVSRLYKNDFFLTWDKTDQEIAGVFAVADALRDLRERNISARI
ncbi:hypothetical protein HJV68_12330, partial [Intestinimonas butyriciproducens]|nr:hypothetical protein [Intestinimonas butyriciproducens]